MERQFQINWPALVEEAKQRRKSQNLTQQRLSRVAGVSTPTISRFESGDEDIQVSSAIKILSALGMTDKRKLDFPDSQPERMPNWGIRFWGQDGEKLVRCEIEYEALRYNFKKGSDASSSLTIFEANQAAIEHEARRKYLAGDLEHDGSVFVKIVDLL